MSVPICVKCKHYAPSEWACFRPHQQFDVVRGEYSARYNLDPWDERHIGWADRLRRLDKCGPAGIYFEEQERA